MAHRIGLLLARVQTGRVYDYAFFMLAGLFTAFVLIDFVINPTGAAFLAESANLFHKSSPSCTSLVLLSLTPPYHVFAGWPSNRTKVSSFAETGMTSTTATRTSTSAATKQSAVPTSSGVSGYTFSAMISR